MSKANNKYIMSDLELYLSFVDSFKKKIEQIAIRKEKQRQESFWRELTPYEFEMEVGKWYLVQGYDVRITQPSKDGGVDIVLSKNNVLTYVQCKHYKSKIGVAACRELGGVMLPNRVKKGVIVTLEGVTKKAQEYCAGARIKIVTLRTLLRSHRDAHLEFIRSMEKPTLPFRSNLPTPFEEREIYGYYIYGNTYPDFKQAAEEIKRIPIANLTNMYDTKAIVKHQDHFFIIYSSAEKIKWLGNDIYRYIYVQSGELVSPRTLQR